MVFSVYMPKSKITISYGKSYFYSYKNLHTVRHNWATEVNWYCFPLWLCQSIFSPTMYMRLPFSPHPLHHLLFVDFLMIAILTGMSWYLILLLICISLILSDVQCLFMFLLAICMSSLEKCVFKSSTYFLIADTNFFFLMSSCKRCCIFWRIIPCCSCHL